MNLITTPRLRSLIRLLMLSCWAAVTCRADLVPPVRIMPLGDSLTQGYTGQPGLQGGYRNELYRLLTEAGYLVDFIGSKSDSNNPGLPDTDHQGVPGARIDDLTNAISGWLDDLDDPDVILLGAGTNDFTGGGGIAETQDRLRNLIAALSTSRPYAKIIVASLLRRTDNAGTESLQVQYNQAVPGIVAEQAALGRQVSFLDLHAALEPGDLFDGVHPHSAGYAKLGACWFPAVTSVITPLGVPGPPTITRLDSRTDLEHLSVTFNKPVDDAAASVDNFSLSGGVAVLQAALDPVSKRVVTLTTDSQSPGALYSLFVQGVTDRTPERNPILPNTTREFTSRTLIDGSFEADGLGWSFSGNNFVIGSPLPATDGTKLVVFNGAQSAPNGVASQQIETIPGKTYKLDFDMGVNGSATPQSLNVTVAGNFPLLSQTEELAGPGDGATLWANKAFEFVANSPITTITFEDSSATTSNVDLLLDDVRLNQEITPLLTVESTPYDQVNITVSPDDTENRGNGTTVFTRTYPQGTSVSLTAPPTSGTLNFEKWQRDGLDYSTSMTISAAMDANHTLKAVYSILDNGSFELGTADGNGVVTNVTSWNTSGEVFAYVANAPYTLAPYTSTGGSRLLVFNGPSATPSGVVSQSFPTVGGQMYLLEFDMGVLGTAQQQLQVALSGATQLPTGTYSVTGASANLPVWQSKSHEFTAGGTTTTLTFTDVSSTAGNVDLLLDRVRVRLVEANTAPVAVNDAHTAGMDTPLVVAASGVLANDVDLQGDPLSAVVDAQPTHGSVTLNPNGGFTYTPTTGFTGTDEFTYHASDGLLDSNIATVTIAVNPVAANLLVNGSFEQGAADGNGVATNVTGWTGSGSQFGYVANAPYTATNLNRLMVFHGGPTPVSGVLSQAFATTPGQAYLLEYDMGAVATENQVQQFAVTVSGTGMLLSQTDTVLGTGQAASGWATKRHFFVANSTLTTLIFTDVSPTTENADLLLDNVKVTSTSNRVITVTSSPASGATVIVSPVDTNGGSNGNTSFNRGYPNGTSVSLTAPATHSGQSFTKWQRNNVDFSTDAGINVTVDDNYVLNAVYAAANSAPVAGGDSYSVNQNTQLVIAAPGVLSNDTDAQSNTLTTVLDTTTAHGSLTLDTNGGFTYNPTPGYSGPDSFTYHANDGLLNSNVVSVAITVNAAGSEILINGSFEDDVTGWTVSGSQFAPFAYAADGTYMATDGSKLMIFNGGQMTTPDGVISQAFSTTPGQTYTLVFNMGAIGTPGVSQQFAVQVAGTGTLLSVTDSVVAAGASTSVWANKIHTFTADSNTTTLTFTDVSSTGISIDLLLDRVRVVPNDYRILTVTSSPGGGANVAVTPPDLFGAGNGVTNSTTFTRYCSLGSTVNLSAALTVGPVTFAKWQKNGLDYSTNSSVSVLIDGNDTMNAVYVVNSAPVAAADSYSATRDVTLTVAAPGVLFNDTDGDADSLTAVLVSGPAHGILTLAPNGGFTYAPASGYVGSDFFTYKANDGLIDSNPVNVAIEVNIPIVNLVSNGSFEQGSPANFGSLTDWNADGAAVGYTSDGSYIATDSIRMALFNSGGDSFGGSIYQDIATLPGQAYQIVLNVGIVGINGGKQSLLTTVNGSTLLLSVPEQLTCPGALQWLTRTYTFVADSTTSRLTLLDNSGIYAPGQATFCDLLLDNVRVTVIGNARTLTVESSPISSLPVTVSPADLGGAGNGSTVFTRSYANGTSVTLTALAASGANVFQKWQKNGSDITTNPATVILMDENHTMNAVYIVDNSPRASADSYSTPEDGQLTVGSPGVLANDVEPNALGMTAVIGTTTAHGSLTLASDGGFVYVPNPDFFGADTFTYYATNGTLNSAITTVTLSVTGIGDPCVAIPQTLVTVEDTPLAITLAGTDVDGDVLAFGVGTAAHGTLTGVAPNLTYTPTSNYNGPDSFTFTVNDGSAPSSPATISITVTPVADPPVATSQSLTMTAGTSLPVTLTGSDPEGEPIDFIVVTSPINGKLSGIGPNLTYTPVSTFVGSDSFTFKTNDGTADSAIATVSITIGGVLKNGSFEIVSGSPSLPDFWTTSGNFLIKTGTATLPSTHPTTTSRMVSFNDTNMSAGGTLSQTFATTPGRPYDLRFSLGAFAGTFQHRLRVTLTGSSLIKTEDFPITGPGGLAHLWTEKSMTFIANSSTTILQFLDAPVTSAVGNNSDMLLDNVRLDPQLTHTLTVASSPDPGVNVTVSPVDFSSNGNGVTGFSRVYLNSPLVNLSVPAVIGAKNFKEWRRDGVLFSASNSTSVTMTADYSMTAVYVPNAPPITTADSYTTNEDVPLVVPASGILANDSDPENVSLTTVLEVGPAHGTLLLAPNGGFTYSPDADYFGEDSFTYQAFDGVVNSAITTVSLVTTSVNDTPTATGQSLSIAEDGNLPVTLTGSDLETSEVTFVGIETPANGTLSGTAPNLVYHPNLNFTGSDSFTFKVSDGTVESLAATVSLTVTAVNDAPVATAQSLNGAEDTDLPIVLAGTDADGDSLMITDVGTPANGTLSGTVQNLVYHPNLNFNGSDSFTFKVSDGTLTSLDATVSLTVTAVNDAPVATAQSLSGAEDTDLPVMLAGTDADGDSLTITDVGTPANGTLSGTSPNLVYHPNLNFNGSDSFTFKVGDGTLESMDATVSLTVTAVNDAPVAAAQSLNGAEDTDLPVVLAGTDADGDSLTITDVGTPANGTLSGTPPNLVYHPNLNFNGSDSFTFKVSDGTLTSNDAAVSITVTAVNDAPVAVAQSLSGAEDTDLPIVLAGTDADGDLLTITDVSTPANGILSGTPPNLVYHPNLNFTGSDSFTFKASDGTLESVSATASITVTAVNDAPVATAQLLSGAEDTDLPVVLAGTDADGDSLTITDVGTPVNGTLTGAAPNLIYHPKLNFTGSDSFTFKVSDGTLESMAATISITVTAVNDAPVAAAQSLSGAEDTDLPIVLTGTDLDGDSLTIIDVGTPANGTLSGTAPNLIYHPNLNFNGSDSFTFKVSDGTLASLDAAVSITVTAVNDAPVAMAQSLSGAEDTDLPIVLAGTDADGDSLTITDVSSPANGTLSGTPPNLVYHPNLNFTGSDGFTFKANDGTLESVSATVSLTVTAVNDAPVATAQSLSGAEDTDLPVVLVGTDADGDSLTFIDVGTPANGTLSGTAPNLVYHPNFNFTGPDSFSFKVSDGTLESADATISITVTAVNDAPVATAQSLSGAEDTDLPVMLAGTDADGDSLTITDVGTPANGTLSGTPPNLVYHPNLNFTGSDSFTFKVSDGTLASLASTISITVTAVNDAPVATAQSLSGAEDTDLPIVLAGTDLDGDSLTITDVGTPANGTLSGTPPNLVYHPNLNFTGPDSFTFKVSDGTLESMAATVSLTVTAVNDAPVATAQSLSGAEDTDLPIVLAGTDADGDSLTITDVGTPANGTLSGTPPNLVYHPNPNFTGSDSFSFKVSDGTLASLAATISLTVTAVNDVPVAMAQSLTGAEDTDLPILLVGTDADGDSLTITDVGTPANGTLSGTAPALVYHPNLNFTGSDSFTFKVSDGTLASLASTISITVTAVNDAPVAVAQSLTGAEDTDLPIVLGGTDLDGDSVTITDVGNPANGTLSGTAPNLVYYPNLDFTGSDSFTFKVSDGTVESLAATISITVTPVVDDSFASWLASFGMVGNPGVDPDHDGITNAVEFVIGGNPKDRSDVGLLPTVAKVIADPDSKLTNSEYLLFTYRRTDLSKADDRTTIRVEWSTNFANWFNTQGTPGVVVVESNDEAALGVDLVRVYIPHSLAVGGSLFARLQVFIDVPLVNSAPVAQSQALSVNEDIALPVTLAATDVDGNSLTYAIVAQPLQGTLSGSAPNLTYTPAPNFHGNDSFTFKANDGAVDSATATVSITVNSVIDDNFANWMSSFGLIGNPQEDPDYDTITNGVEFLIGGNPKDRSDVGLLPRSTRVTADPDGNQTSTDYLLFTYRRTDLAKNDDLTTIRVDWSTDFFTWTNSQATPGVVVVASDDEAALGVDLVRVYLPRSLAVSGRLFARLTVSIAVPHVNNAPVAQPQSVSVDEGVMLPITLAATDSNSDALSYSVASGPAHGSLSGSGKNLIYTPAPTYSGPDSFTFVANDGTVNSAPATISIIVNSVSNFNLWMTGYGVSSSPTADSDHDSISNAIEYVIGGDPAGQSGIALLPTMSMVTADPDGNLVNSDYLLFTYRRSDVANTDSSTTITVEWSSSLGGSWTNVANSPGVQVVPLNNAAGPNVDLVEVYIPRSLAIDGKLFARLSVAVAVPETTSSN